MVKTILIAALVANATAADRDGIAPVLVDLLEDVEFRDIQATPEDVMREITRRCNLGDIDPDDCEDYAADIIRDYDSRDLMDILPDLVDKVGNEFPDFGRESILAAFDGDGDYDGDHLPHQLRDLPKRTDDDVDILLEFAEGCAEFGNEEDSCLDRVAGLIEANPDHPINDAMVDFIVGKVSADDRWDGFKLGGGKSGHHGGVFDDLPDVFQHLDGRDEDEYDDLLLLVTACEEIDDDANIEDCFERVASLVDANPNFSVEDMFHFIEERVSGEDKYGGFHIGHHNDDDEEYHHSGLPEVLAELVDRDDYEYNEDILYAIADACEGYDDADDCLDRVGGLIADNSNHELPVLLDFISQKVSDDDRFHDFHIDWYEHHEDHDEDREIEGWEDLPDLFQDLGRGDDDYDYLVAFADACEEFGNDADDCIRRVAGLLTDNSEHDISQDLIDFIEDAVHKDNRFREFAVHVGDYDEEDDHNNNGLPNQLQKLKGRDDDYDILEAIDAECALFDDYEECLDRVASLIDANENHELEDMLEWLEGKLADDGYDGFLIHVNGHHDGDDDVHRKINDADLPRAFRNIHHRSDEDNEILMDIVDACRETEDFNRCIDLVADVIGDNDEYEIEDLIGTIEDELHGDRRFRNFNLGYDHDDDEDTSSYTSELMSKCSVCSMRERVACYSKAAGFINNYSSSELEDILNDLRDGECPSFA